MGGFLSAPLACIDAMRQEHTYRNHLKNCLSFCFRDDIILIFPQTLDDKTKKHWVEKLNKIYGPDLEVELEESYTDKIAFLEFYTFHDLSITHYNKNIHSKLPEIKHFPDYRAPYSKTIFISTVIGTLKRIFSCASNTSNQIKSLSHILMEFIQKYYPTKILIEGLHLARLPLQITIKIRTALRSRCPLETLHEFTREE